MDTALLNLSTKLSGLSPRPSTPPSQETLVQNRNFLNAFLNHHMAPNNQENGKEGENPAALPVGGSTLEKSEELSFDGEKIDKQNSAMQLQFLIGDRISIEKKFQLLDWLETNAEDNKLSASQIRNMPREPKGRAPKDGFWPHLLELFKSENPELRSRMVTLVGTMTDNHDTSQQAFLDENGIPALVQVALSDSDADVRKKAIKSLTRATRNHKAAFEAAQKELPDRLKLRIALRQGNTEIINLEKYQQPSPNPANHPSPDPASYPSPNPASHSEEDDRSTEEVKGNTPVQSTETLQDGEKLRDTVDVAPATTAVTMRAAAEDSSEEVLRAEVRFTYLDATIMDDVDWLRNELLVEVGLPRIGEPATESDSQEIEVESNDESKEESTDSMEFDVDSVTVETTRNVNDPVNEEVHN